MKKNRGQNQVGIQPLKFSHFARHCRVGFCKKTSRPNVWKPRSREPQSFDVSAEFPTQRLSFSTATPANCSGRATPLPQPNPVGWLSFCLAGMVWLIANFATPLLAAEEVLLDEQGFPAARNEKVTQEFRRQRIINQTLLRNPFAAVLVDRLEQKIQSRSTMEALAIYQQILDQSQDYFLWDAQGEIQTVRQQALTLFEQHPELWKPYQELHAGSAEALLNGDVYVNARNVVQKYFHTPAGRKAVSALASQAWDRGELAEAVSLWRMLLESRYHEPHLTERQREQIQVAFSILETPISWKGAGNADSHSRLSQAVTAVQTHQDLAGKSLPISWSQPRHSARLERAHEKTAPLQSFCWSFPRSAFRADSFAFQQMLNQQGHAVAEQEAAALCTFIQGALEQWSSQQHEQLTCELTTLFGVAVGSKVFYRDWEGVYAVDLRANTDKNEKQRLWRFSSPGPYLTAMLTGKDPLSGSTTNHPNIERLYLTNSLSGSLTTDGRQVYLVDSIQRLQREQGRKTAAFPHSPSHLNHHEEIQEPEPQTIRLTNRLVALPTRAAGEKSAQSTEPVAESESVQPLWTLDSQGLRRFLHARSELSFHPLQGHYFLGPPTVENQRAYIMSEYENLIVLSALEPETGDCLWSQPLSHVDRSLEHDLMRATRACVPVCAEGRVICDNGNGQLVAVDAVLGTLQWTYGYADEESRQESGRWTYTQSARVSQPGALNVPVISGSQVLLLPDRSYRIQCCDLQTGKLLWTRKREDVEYLAEIYHEPGAIDSTHSKRAESSDLTEPMVVAVGRRSCSALNSENGETLWTARTGFVSGHGAQAGHLYLLPVSELSTDAKSLSQAHFMPAHGQILAIDLRTGLRCGYELPLTRTELIADGDDSARTENSGYRFPLGNLLISEGKVVSVGMDQLAVYQQAGSLLKSLAEKQKMQSLNEAQLQQWAEACLALGEIGAAKQHLQLALQQSQSSESERNQTLAMYREVLYQELHEQTAHRSSEGAWTILEEIDLLANTPEQRARYLVKEIDLLLKNENYADLWEATNRFAQLGMQVPISSRQETGYLTTSTCWMPEVYTRLLRQLSHSERQELFEQVEQHWLTKMEVMTEDQLQTLLETFSEIPHWDATTLVEACQSDLTEETSLTLVQKEFCTIRDALRLELISRAMHQKNYQAAELQLLQLKHSRASRNQMVACQGLVKLYSLLGLNQQAASYLQELSLIIESSGDRGGMGEQQMVSLSAVDIHKPPKVMSTEYQASVNQFPSWSGQDYLTHFDRSHPAWQLYQQKGETFTAARSINLRQEPAAGALAVDPYLKRRHVHLLSAQNWSVLQQLDLPDLPAGSAKKFEEQHLVVLDRQRGKVLTRIALPGTKIGVSNLNRKQVGHFLPITVEGQIYGISLLEGRPIWQRTLDSLETLAAAPHCEWLCGEDGVMRVDTAGHSFSRRGKRIELGPVGNGYLLFQTARGLTCLHPADGRLLWKRSDLDPQGGLWSDRSTGLIGDAQALVYFHPDQNHYTVLETKTGEIVREGILEEKPIQVQRTRYAFGRHLMYLSISTQSPHERRLRLWDPLQEKFAVDQLFGERDLFHTSDEELTLLLDGGKLLIHHPEQGKKQVELTLPEEVLSRANYLRVISLPDRYLVNIYQTQRIDKEDGYTSRFTDAPWNLTHINGPVVAINKKSNQLEWTKVFPNRSVIEEPSAELPFVLMCATHQAHPGEQERNLLVEIVDLRTGESLKMDRTLSSKRMILLNHDRQKGEVRLSGLTHDYVINYQQQALSE